MSFLYFVPGTDINSVDLDAVGLGYAFEGPPDRSYNAKGFDGSSPGALLMQKGPMPAGRLKLNPPEQVWKEQKRFWVGYWKDLPPTEESLRRKTMLAGSDLTLQKADWTIPTAICFEEYNGDVVPVHQLSRYIECHINGEVTLGEVEQQFAPLMDVALRFLESVDPEVVYTKAECWAAAAMVLSYNYRIRLPELSMLKILTDKSAADILNICVDMEELGKLCIEKKVIDDVETSTNAGAPESAPVSSPPQPISI